MVPRYPSWGHAGARLGPSPYLCSGCQRPVADLSRNAAIPPGPRLAQPPQGGWAGLGAAGTDVGARRRAPGAPAPAPFGVSEVGGRVRPVRGLRGW